MITIKTEADRMPAAIAYARSRLDELNSKIKECDYVEDVNGKLIYEPGSYSEEKREYEHEARQWEIMLRILEGKTPFSTLDY